MRLATRGAAVAGATVTAWALNRRVTAVLDGGSGGLGEVRLGMGSAVRADKDTFVVTVAGKKLYAGLVYSSEFSKSRAVPVLLPTRLGLRIERAYPTARYAAVADPRPQAAVKKVFQLLRRLR